MDSSNVLQLLEQLDDEIDDLEESLAPLLKTALSESASKLPLLDKAKLYVLVTYAIESIIFAYLRLNGVKAREHPVFKELTRVKQYFDKIKAAETPIAVPERGMAVDKGAAARFIKAGLAGNDKYDLEHAERQAKERARAHIKFEELTSDAKKRKAEEPEQHSKDGSSSSSDSDSSSEEDEQPTVPHKKKQRVERTPGPDVSSGSSTPVGGKVKNGGAQREAASQKNAKSKTSKEGETTSKGSKFKERKKTKKEKKNSRLKS